MWLNLDINGIKLYLRISGYKTPTKDEQPYKWCHVDMTLQSRKWLNYIIENVEILLTGEVDELIDKTEKLLNDELESIVQVECVEPDLKFVFHPKLDLRTNPRYSYVAPGYEIQDIYMELEVYFWDSGITKNKLVLIFYREDLQNLLNYLLLVSNRVDESNEMIIKMIDRSLITRMDSRIETEGVDRGQRKT